MPSEAREEINIFMETLPLGLIVAFYYLLWEIKNNTTTDCF